MPIELDHSDSYLCHFSRISIRKQCYNSIRHKTKKINKLSVYPLNLIYITQPNQQKKKQEIQYNPHFSHNNPICMIPLRQVNNNHNNQP